jgi:branched-chain amino acid transport system substrate-binding protein
LTADLGIERIAILYQDDSYGQAGLSGVKKALTKRGMSLVGEGAYKRNTIAVKSALLKIRKSSPEAIVMVGAYKPCAEFIRVAKKLKMDVLFVNISFVGSDALSKELGSDGEGVIISQVVPFPYTPEKSAIVASYQTAMKNYKPGMDFGFVSLEGYITGRFAIKILKETKGQITPESFLDTIYRLENINIDGLRLKDI